LSPRHAAKFGGIPLFGALSSVSAAALLIR
jgi:hypothetical protein